MTPRIDWLAALLVLVLLLGGVVHGQDADTKLALMEARLNAAEKRAETAEKRLGELEKTAKPTSDQAKTAARESFAKMWKDAREAAIAGCRDAKGRGQAKYADGKVEYVCSW